MKGKLITVFGGTGFVGRHLVQRLASKGARVQVAVRHPKDVAPLQPMGNVGQIVGIKTSVAHGPSVRAAVSGADAVVNLVGILHESGHANFDAIHRQGAENVAQAAREAGVDRLVHMSALGADSASPSTYAKSKAAGEEAVRAAFPGATIMRPSVIFGPEDGFFNRFASIARISPVLPVIGCPRPQLRNGKLDIFGDGGVKFQPVYVGNVADAFVKSIEDPAFGGKTYELGGPAVYSFKEIMEMICRETGRRRLLLPVPYFMATLMASVLQLLPRPMLTTDQVELLKRDNVISGALPGLEDLGIQSTGAEAVIPTYLDRYRPGGRFTKPRGPEPSAL